MRISEKTGRYRWAKDVLRQLKDELEPMMASPLAIPLVPGGWWHQYVCPEHHTELLFDPQERDADEFVCPYGCRLHGEPYRGAWLVMKHQSYARYALQAAAVFAGTGDNRFAEWSASILLRYAEQFPQYPIHPEAEGWMLKGRAFHQALTEAIWATTLIRTCQLLLDEGYAFHDGQPKLDTFFSMLEESMTQARHILVKEQNKPESNYTAWLNAALAGIYALKRDKDKLAELVHGEAGLEHHLTIGVKADHMEYEGATYYHIFVLRAYFIVVEMAARLGIDLYGIRGEQGQSLEGMLDVMALLANEQGELIALHDGPYQRIPYAREIAETVEIGLSRFGKADYVPMLKEAYRQMYGKPERAGLEAILYGREELDGYLDSDPEAAPAAAALRGSSVLLEPSGFVIGRRPGGVLSFFADFGPHGGSHGHYDKLHLTLAGRDGWLAPELGMVPYGSVTRKDWYACTASHNTIVVNQASQAAHTGELVRFDETGDGTYAWLRSRGAYDGCTLDRHLLLTDEWLLDWYEVELESEAVIDWWMHSPKLSAVYRGGQWRSHVGSLSDKGAYSYVRTVSEWQPLEEDGSGKVCRVEMSGPAGQGVALSALSADSSQLFLATTPGTADKPARTIDGLLHRQRGTKAAFVTVYSDSSMPADICWLSAEGEHPVPGSSGGQAKSAAISFRNGIWHAVLDSVQGLRLERQ
ncbi:heparinase II/III family protein [Paenibacillus sp. NPDC056579]|uniref:heparinase II/III domain-containing protein n=1 Tax=Paenibacillus sp. NPDC056579 TaxID=3345871 RepID=UPI00368319E1